jgi:DeoR family transcriptional regulator, fructose operon transcriptional repressor
MNGEERRQVILDYIDEIDEVNTSILSEKLQISRPTIHRDLNILEKEGYLKKTTNGAIKVNDFLIEKDSYFSHGLRVDTKEKKAIAKKAFTHINSGETIIIDAGTINYFLAREINKSNIVNLNIFTNNIVTQLVLLKHRDKFLRVFATGGMIKDGCFSTLGDFMYDVMKASIADVVFLTTKGIDMDGNLTEYDYGDCVMKKLFLEKTKTKILLCQSQKFDKVAVYNSTNISEFNTVITDSGIYKKKEFIDLFKKLKINLQVVKV